MNERLARLEKELGAAVTRDPDVLAAHRHDAWMLAELLDLEGRGAPAPLAVLRPQSTEDVSKALALCRELGLAVVPFGGGSGVCGAVEATPETVVLSTRGLEGLVELDATNLLARFRAGTLGRDAEERCRQERLTIGHWPQSVDVSTVGGWVATRAAGQYSTAYGNIEDLVTELEVVLPDGRLVRTAPTPRASSGPDLRQLFLGSEGTLGVVTEVTFSLRPLPEESRGTAWHFASLGAGLEALRKLVRAGWQPPVARLYDAPESQRQFSEWCPEGRALLILVHEGPAARVEAECRAVAGFCAAEAGTETASAAVDHWLDHRNRVPTFRELLERGLVVDTIEVAAYWDRIPALYDAVTRAVSAIDGVRAITAHSSHSYRSGTNLYFTFVAKPEERARMAETYRACWRATMEATLRAGGGIAHHHGIGRVRRDFLADELGANGLALLRSVKHALDPDGLLNPGALLPEE